MSNNIPLNDQDRWDWLITLKNEAVKRLENNSACVVTCSALKKKYRDVIRVANYEHPSVQIHFVFLKLNEEVLQQRVKERVGHYMKAEMVHSQMLALEEPDVNVETDVIEIDVHQGKEEVQNNAWNAIEGKIKEYDELLRERKKKQLTNGTST